jgi:hypothetical protein
MGMPASGAMRAPMLAVVCLAAWCCAPGASAAPSEGPHRVGTVAARCGSRSEDASAKTMTRTAETAAETFSTDHNGEYTHMTRSALHAIEPTLALTHRAARRQEEKAYLSEAWGSSDAYRVTARAFNGDTFTIERQPGVGVARFARVCGRRLPEW